MSNEILARIGCDACNCQDAGVKRRKNGRRLLYIHCPKCGTDQRSGQELQKRLEKIVEKALKGETPEPIAPKPTLEISEPLVEEWTPQQQGASAPPITPKPASASAGLSEFQHTKTNRKSLAKTGLIIAGTLGLFASLRFN